MIINHKELSNIRHATAPQTVALTVGCFDIVHEGHLEQLEFSANQADLLAVAIMPDEYVRKRKGPSRPVNSQYDRAENIDNSELVDYTFIAPKSLLALARTVFELRPNVFVEHKEHAEQRSHFLKSLFLGSLAITLVVNEDAKVNSTTEMIQRYGYEGALERSLRLGTLLEANDI